MIYNLVHYLRTELSGSFALPEESIRIQESEEMPDECIVLRESGGYHNGYPDMLSGVPVQVLAFAKDRFDAQAYAELVFRKLQDIHMLTLPAIVETGSPAPNALEVVRIHALQKPNDFGVDENGRWRFICNYLVEFQDGTYPVS